MDENNSSGGQNLSPPAFSGLCKQGCGFYGSSQFDGMCSKCYKDYVARQNSKDQAAMNEGQTQRNVMNTFQMASGSSNPLTSGAQPTCNTATASAAATSSGCPSSYSAMETQEDTQILPAPANPVSQSSEPTILQEELSDLPPSEEQSAPSEPLGQCEKKQRKNRCNKCNKKVGLMGFECRCGHLFCSAHRYSDAHSCEFDFHSHGQAAIRKANPQIQAAKLEKI